MKKLIEDLKIPYSNQDMDLVRKRILNRLKQFEENIKTKKYARKDIGI